MRSSRFQLAAPLALLLALSTGATGAYAADAPTATETPSCESDATIAPEELDAAQSVPGCDLTGATIVTDDGLHIAVPAEGFGVIREATTADGNNARDYNIFQDEDHNVGLVLNDEVYGEENAFPGEVLDNEAQADTQGSYGTANKCSSSSAYNPKGTKQLNAFKWWYNADGSGGSGSLDAIHRALITVPHGTTSCNGNTVYSNGATSDYQEGGQANGYHPNVGTNAACGDGQDGHSTAGWVHFSSSSQELAVTCATYNGFAIIVDADIAFNNNRFWYRGESASGCTGSQFDLEGIAVHEGLHAFGLGHVSASTGQVMQEAVDYCRTSARKMGIGDANGMIHNYGN